MAKKKKRKINIIFLLSLITHLSLLLIIVSFAFKKFGEKNKKIVLLKKNQKIKNELPASLKPRKSNFGTTVFFDDTPKFTPPKTPKMSEKTLNVAAKQQPKRPEQKKAIQQTQKKNVIVKKHFDKKKTFLAKTEVEILKQVQHNTQDNREKKIEEEERKKEQTKKILKQVLDETHDNKKAIEKIKPIMAAERIRNIGPEKKDLTPKVIKKKSILAMTKGFLQNLKDEGTDWIKRDGDDNKKPDLEDLKHISYVQKVFWQFQQETGIRHAHMSFQEKVALFRGFRVNPRVLLVISEKGYLDEISLALSSGSESFDRHILSSFKAASPYPPIPKHLNKKVYRLPVEIINPKR